MNFQTTLAAGLMALGAVIMVVSIYSTRKMLSRLQQSPYRPAWQTLLILMGLFLLGYLGSIYLVFAEVGQIMTILVGVVFFFGALFVYLVVRVGYLTIVDLQATAVSKDQLEAEVQNRTAEISATNAELRQSQVELARARDEAMQANRAKSVFLANMSHELRTPLNAILGYSEMLQEDLSDMGETEMVSDLQKIHRSGKHLLNIINDVLDLSKIEAGRMTMHISEFDLDELLEDVLSAIQPLVIRNGNDLQSLPHGKLGMMYADQTKVRQILFNLLSNASKFTEKGLVALDAQRQQVDGQESFVFEVRDTGIGMTDEQMKNLFQPFVQADSSTTKEYGGTGLGLAITKLFCEMMGGHVEVTSTWEVGSTFIVYLPIHTPERYTETIASGKSGNKRRILVIDDDPVTRDLMQRFLLKEGLQVELATGGQQGLEMAKQLQPDLITLDVMMPDMDGWSVLSQLKSDKTTADIPVVMLTMIDDKQRGYALGATDYLGKPIDRERLLHVVQRYQGWQQHDDAPILIVDDESATREMVRRMLQKEGWEVMEAGNGRVALDLIAAQKPALILLDLMMPEMDGFEFVDQLRQDEDNRHIPVIVITAKDLSPDEQQRLQGYVERIVQKAAYSRDSLLDEVRELVLAQS
jgi:signal transduction histidine kinase/DNA-binding response OmpR family regulator